MDPSSGGSGTSRSTERSRRATTRWPCLSNKDKHRLLLPVVAAVGNTDTWMATTNAEVDLAHYAPGAVRHDGRIMTFTARPTDPHKKMVVEPQSGLEVQIGEIGMFYP
jgi:hypothetical protein